MNFAAPLTVDRFLTLPSRVLAAPMEGVMSPAFRAAANTLGTIPVWITPFFSVSADSVPSERALRRDLAPFRNGGPLIVQLLGTDAASLTETALRLADCGAAGVNLNFACPSPFVTRGHRGGAVLRDPALLHDLCAAVQTACSGQLNVSVKLRTGVVSPEELPRIAAAVRNAGIRFAMVHFRTVSEMYSPVPPSGALARLARFRVLAGPDMVVFGNGDIREPADAVRMIAATGCDGVAVARGLAGDPYLVRRIEGGAVPPGDGGIWQFLYLLGENSARKYRRAGFLECARMAFGAENAVFRHLVRLSDSEIHDFLLTRLDSDGLAHYTTGTFDKEK